MRRQAVRGGRAAGWPALGATLTRPIKSKEDRRGLTALFWSNVNPYGTFRLVMDKRLDLGLTVPRPRTRADAAERSTTKPR
ncbi:hypothetical protein [Streptomyces ficellus]|uniref:Tn3 transposase DDE domain-containing protein n=1 Tax=Streptomyces ficellus TaxID=1977088 RepID=A0A6I6FQS0_9ACTN|nr:hypothetical protein [Streptomyces ficellus]QGV81975.1 hypothetical protein EIZ62_29745 [Streptomyces ficellus]